VGAGEEPSDNGETHTENIGGRQKENRGCRTCTLGEVQNGEEEGSLELAFDVVLNGTWLNQDTRFRDTGFLGKKRSFWAKCPF